jgi:hypothetical protein
MTTSKVLGIASYSAVRSPGTGTVKLKASGIFHCANYSAQLELRPERPVPPMWSMVFFIENFCLKAVKPFEVSVLMEAGDARNVIVHDLSGEVVVPIADPILPIDTSHAISRSAETFVVYARVPPPHVKLAKPTGCIIVPEASLITSIYYRVFGPASHSECANWITKNCNADVQAFGGEVPWPKFVENKL